MLTLARALCLIIPGAPEVLDHYQKVSCLISSEGFENRKSRAVPLLNEVKEDLELQLAKPGILRYKTMDVPDVDLRSTLSTIAAWTSSPTVLQPAHKESRAPTAQH